MPFKFRIRWIPLIACAVAVAIGISLGQWQTRRADEKEAIERKLAQREAAPAFNLNSDTPGIDDIEYRKARVTGEFINAWTVYLDNRPYRGVPGFYVLMPFKIAGSNQYILVMCGWAQRDIVNRTKLPNIKTPANMIEIEGIVRRNAGHVLQLGAPERLKPGAIVQNVDVAEFAQASGFALKPFLIEQVSDTGDGLIRDWPRPSIGIEKHRGYAFQWYALAAMAFLFFVVTGLRRGTR